MTTAKRTAEFERRFKIAAYTEKWAVTMTKVCIRQAVASSPFPHWYLLTFAGPAGAESRGVVDMLAIRKDHRKPYPGTKRGDLFQIVLIQIKGGFAPKPTTEDGKRLQIVARRHGAVGVLLATWKKGTAAKFYALQQSKWNEVHDLASVFG
jgi:hypothetical protein